MRYAVYGAGAIGGAIGGSLHQAGRDVVLIARGPHLDALQEGGLIFQAPAGEERLPIESVASPQEVELGPDGVVVMAMKSQDTHAALEELAQVADPRVAVVCAQNGVNNERLALRYFNRVYGVFVYVAAQHLEAGVVQLFSSSPSGVLDVGRCPASIDERARAICADLEAAGFTAHAEPLIMRWKYGKLLSNLANAVEALLGPDYPAGDLVRRTRSEALACFAAGQIDWATEEEISRRTASNEELRPIEGSPRKGGSSWQSLARGSSSIETDYLNGEIVLLGRLHGLATPANAALCQVARRMVRDRAEPGSVDPNELQQTIAFFEGDPANRPR
jgi:2-dehydropantoate 2-reductase